jgi:hypothetical protein
MMRKFWGVLVAVALLAGCGSSSSGSGSGKGATRSTTAKSSPEAWTGFGAQLAHWESAHPKGSGGAGSGCTNEGCFGEELDVGGETVHQFTGFSTTGAPEYRVEGYDQAFRDGTSIGVAKVAVRKLLPPDAHPTAFFVSHSETGSCASWNLTSKTVGRWFGTKKIGDTQGRVTVTFDTLSSSNDPEFSTSNVTHAGVSIGATQKGTNC